MHGDWIITVSNPDGSVDSVHEFENKLAGLGNTLLTLLLRGEGIRKLDDGTNDWSIQFSYNKYTYTRDADTSLLYLGEPKSWMDDMEGLQLIASDIVQSGEKELKSVFTAVWFAPNSIPSTSAFLKEGLIPLAPFYAFSITRKDFDKPIPVLPGQEVSATVRISFE